MKMNYNYCKLDENAMLRYAPIALEIGGKMVVNPTADEYAAAGWYKKTATPPDPIEGRVWRENEPSAWVWSSGDMIVEVTYTAEDIPAPEPMSKRYNKYKLACALKDANLVDAILGFFAANPSAKLMWDTAQEFEETDENFVEICNQFVGAFGEETVAAILAKAEA